MIDRRSHPRRDLASPLELTLLDRDGLVVGPGLLLDASVGGLRLQAENAHPPGILLVAALPRTSPLGERRLAFRVTRCEAHPVGGYVLGASLLAPLSPGEENALVAPPPTPGK